MDVDHGGRLLAGTGLLPDDHHIGHASFWLYFADSTLKWNDTAPQKLIVFTIDGYWLKELRDAIAMGLSTLPIIIVLVGGAVMQNWRKRLRGSSGDSRPTGGYR